MSKFHIGQVVRSTRGFIFETVGPIHKIIQPTEELRLLWKSNDVHYLMRDNQTGDFTMVIEKYLDLV